MINYEQRFKINVSPISSNLKELVVWKYSFPRSFMYVRVFPSLVTFLIQFIRISTLNKLFNFNYTEQLPELKWYSEVTSF